MTVECDDLRLGHTSERGDHKRQERTSSPRKLRGILSEGCVPATTRSRPRKRRRNALKHGLSIPITKLPYFQQAISEWHAAIIRDHEERLKVSDEVNAVALDIAIQQCDLVRIALIRQAITENPTTRQKNFSNNDVIHLITVIEGFVVEPHTSPIPFDARTMSMLYRIFGIRISDRQDGVVCADFTHYQVQALASLERYETRSRSRLRKAAKRLRHLLDIQPKIEGNPV